ncbi:MAG: hypothetical protein ACUVXH_02430 [Anaerolineae bacterium]
MWGWCSGHGLGWGGWGGWGLFGPLLSLVFTVGVLAALGLAIAWLVRQVAGRGRPTLGVDPLELAQRRLAAGEITVAEYEEIRTRLTR